MLPPSVLQRALSKRIPSMGRHSRAQAQSMRSSSWMCAALAAVTVVLLLLDLSGLWHSASRHRGGKDGLRSLPQLQQHALSDQDLGAAIKQHHPSNRLECGSWQQPYAKMHAAIVRGDAPQRYALMRSRDEWENGLADRLASSVGILLYAILSGRAFQYDYEGDPQLWEGLRSDFIDWRYTGWDGPSNSSLVMDYVAEHNSEPEFLSFFTHQDFPSIGKDKHTVTWYTDHVVVRKAFDNPHVRARLKDLGMLRETAFACLFDFLYRPTADVIDVVKPQLPVLLDPQTVKIGIQIRIGDWQLVSSHRYWFHPQAYPGLFDHYFDCALQIEREVARPGAGVVWYLLADMAELRAPLAAKHPDRVLVKTDVDSIEHTVKGKSKSRTGFLMACAELWAFSLTDYHVLTRKSGFGKVGAMVNANGEKHIFTIDFPMQVFNFLGLGGPAFDNRKVVSPWQRQRSCRPADADDLDKVCTDFTGC